MILSHWPKYDKIVFWPVREYHTNRLPPRTAQRMLKFGHKKPPSACCKRRWSLTLNPITMSCPIQNPMQFCRLTTVHLFGVISGSLPLTSRPAHVMLLILGWSRSYSAEGFARPVRKGRMAHCGAFACVTFGGDISAPGRWREAFAIYEKERNPCPLPSSGKT